MSRGEGGERESTVRSIIRKERGECTVRTCVCVHKNIGGKNVVLCDKKHDELRF